MTRQSLTSSRLLIASLFLLAVVVNSDSNLRNSNGLRLPNKRVLVHDDIHVQADDHNHAVEIHACEGVELDLEGDASLTAVNVDNARSYLITNIELESCEDIENLKCRPGATICQRWESGSNQNIKLLYNQFKDGKAHFYASAQDKNHVISVNLKIHPEGAHNPNAHHHEHHHATKEEHVHDDSHYHALELQECSSGLLELPDKQDALFDVSSVNNAKRFMVTDIELENCDEIKHFQCHRDAKFCHIWNAHANEMVLLDHGSFHNNEAFFYAEAVNEGSPVSVNVKIVPAVTDAQGNVHAANDPHPEHHTGKSNGGHHEHHVDVDGHSHSVQLEACSGTTVELAGDAVLSAHNVYNGKRWMITNIEMQTCEQITAFVCQAEATFCHIWDAKSDETISLKHNMFSNGEAFFYADPVDHNQEVSVNLKVVPEGAQSHAPHQSGVQEGRMVVDSHVHALELHQCAGTTFELKGDTVLEVENIDNAKNYMVTDKEFETCEEIMAWKCHEDANICHIWPADAHEDILMHMADFPGGEAFFYAQPVDAKQAISVNAKLETLGEHDPKHGQLHDVSNDKVHHVLQNIWLYGGLVVFAFLLITSYCYRSYMSKYKKPMFAAPFWCPNILFPAYNPESHENFISTETRKQESTELNAGIIRQVDV